MRCYRIYWFDRYRADSALENKNINHEWYKGDRIIVNDCDAEDVEAIFYETDVAYDLMKKVMNDV